MPMQPRPRAETWGPVVPSVRVSMGGSIAFVLTDFNCCQAAWMGGLRPGGQGRVGSAVPCRVSLAMREFLDKPPAGAPPGEGPTLLSLPFSPAGKAQTDRACQP